MAIVKAQGRSSTANALTLAYSGAVAAGSLLTAVVRVGNAGTDTTASDGTNGAWTQALIKLDITETMYVFYFPNTAAATPTLTVANPSGGSCRIVIEEFSGAATSSPVRTTSSGGPSGGTGVSSGNVTAVANDLAYGECVSTNGTAGAWTAGGTSAGGSWAISEQNTEANHCVMSQYVVATADGTYASFPTFSPAGDEFASGIVLFKPAAPVAGTVVAWFTA